MEFGCSPSQREVKFYKSFLEVLAPTKVHTLMRKESFIKVF